MEDPIIPAATAVLPAAHARRFAWLHNPSTKTLLVVSGALFIVVVLVNVAISFSFLKFVFLTHGTRVETVENGVPTWYAFSFGTAKKVAGAPDFDQAPVTVLEAVEYGEQGAHAVLARVPGVEGITLGLLHANDTFESILSDGTNKANLAVRPDGQALYAAMMDGESRLMHTDLTKAETVPSDLGRGRSPRLFTDGFFVAVSEEGIVRIDPVSKSVSVLVPSTDADIYNGTISPDGTRVALSNTSSKTLFYTIENTSPGNVALTSVARFTALSPLSFVRDEFLVEPSGNLLTVYENKFSLNKLGSFRFK